jgi:hypothetical protein
MHDLYIIEGTSNIESEQLYGPEYNDPIFYPLFQEKINWLKELLIKYVDEKKGLVILRIYDGEFHFLNKHVCGNGPIRHYSKPLTDEFITKFKEGVYKVDYISVQLNINMLQIYKSLFPDRPVDFPMDIIYGLIANRWILKTFKNRITLIGGTEKIKLIKKLITKQEYKEYICNDYFLDYIEVPERFSCDNTDELIINIGEKIKNSDADVFLFGIGIAKMDIAWQFKKYKDAVFIDIGCGMSALAGTCGIDRPYFGSWINYRIKGYNYSNVDPMDFNEQNGNVVYL